MFTQDMETRQSAQSSQSGKDPIDSSVVNMEIDDTVVIDYPDEPECTLNEDELHQVLKVNSNKCIEHMRISPKEASRFDIPLCRMVYMPLDRPTLASDIKRLEADFAHGYHHGASVFYVTLCNERGEERAVTSSAMTTIGSRLGRDTLTGYIERTRTGTSRWTQYALIRRERLDCC
jgi:hypothetical protein